MVSFCHFNYTMYLGVIFLGLILLGALCSSWSFPRSGKLLAIMSSNTFHSPFSLLLGLLKRKCSDAWCPTSLLNCPHFFLFFFCSISLISTTPFFQLTCSSLWSNLLLISSSIFFFSVTAFLSSVWSFHILELFVKNFYILNLYIQSFPDFFEHF